MLILLNGPFTPSVAIHSDITVLRNLPPFTSPIERSIISVTPTVEGTLSRLRPTPRTVCARVPLPYLAPMHPASWRVCHTFCSTVYIRSPTCDSPSYPYQELRPAPCLRYSTWSSGMYSATECDAPLAPSYAHRTRSIHRQKISRVVPSS